MKSEIPSRFEPSKDWCDICWNKDTPQCDLCDFKKMPCASWLYWQNLVELNLKKYLEFLGHKCLKCNRLEVQFNSTGIQFRQPIDYEYCEFEEKESS